MTREDFDNQHVNMINYLIDLTHEATDVWKFHPENPNKIDAVEYHALKIQTKLMLLNTMLFW